jgi:Transposase IS116/IS110/IS902 family
LLLDTDTGLAQRLFDRLRDATGDGRRHQPRELRRGRISGARYAAHTEGLATERDAGANLIVTVPRRDPTLPFLACGSHLDSVPQGGKYDGAAGVVAGLLALARFRAEGFQPMMLLRMKSPDPALFQSGRQFAAWIGLTPKDHSTAGKVRLGVITRRWRRGIAQRAGRGPP